ncbi:MAG: hypothetical protein WBA39_34115 [Rivularia sp. (in: cyanobacteria)]
MKIPNQSSPIVRNIRSLQVSKGLLPQACFDDCMANTYGIPQCKSAYQSRDAGEIASCLINFGFNVVPWAVGLNIAQCGAKCIFG